MANLLSNAAKFSPEGASVEILIEEKDEKARVSITDHGPGISKEDRDKIFRHFSQVDSSDTRNVGGTGLGLAISRAMIIKHGGTIDFESIEGEGSTFYFNIPLYLETADTEDA